MSAKLLQFLYHRKKISKSFVGCNPEGMSLAENAKDAEKKGTSASSRTWEFRNQGIGGLGNWRIRELRN
jgi:hypothetical protein